MLRMRTCYSFRTAVGTLDDYIDAIPRDDRNNFAPITDRCSAYGWIKWPKMCEERGLKPVLGVELAVTNELYQDRPSHDYWLFFTYDHNLARLSELVELATKQSQWHKSIRQHLPLLSYEQTQKDGIIAIAGYKAIVDKIPEGVYAPLTPALSRGQYRRFTDAGFKFAAVGENYYPTPSDEARYEVICGRGASSQTYPQYMISYEEFATYIARKLGSDHIEKAWETSLELAGRCSLARPAKAILPDPKPSQSLAELCDSEMVKRGLVGKGEYRDRLEKELALIREKKFDDYFHIVGDACRWARKRMLVGPARGSAAGSLVCFLLDITTVDPLLHGLIFERFVDINRPDLPDIDIDFNHSKRDMVIEYIQKRYGGEAHASRLGTVNRYASNSALNEVCGALRIPKWKVQATVDSMIKRSSGDARALHTLEDTFKELPAGQKLVKDHPEIKIVQQMQGHPTHVGKHAAAVVLNANPLREIAPVDQRSGAIMLDKYDAEEVDLLKIDALGLTHLSILEEALELAGLPKDTLEKLPLDQQEAFDLANEGRFSGIFQVQGDAVQSIARSIHIESFEDIAILSALGRPGPLASGNATRWVQRRTGQHKVSYPHPLFEPYLKDTLGIVIYQEQVMEIGRKIGDLGWGEVTALRKAMSKSLGKEFFDQYGDPWKEGARKKGIPDSVLDQMWDDLCLSGDTILENPYPSKGRHRFMTLESLYKRGGLIGNRKRQSLLMWDGDTLKPARNWGVSYSGKQQTYTLKTKSGLKLHATEHHKILCDGLVYRRLRDLSPGDKVIADAGHIPTPRKTPKKVGSGGHNWWHKLQTGEPILKHNLEYLRTYYKNCQVCFQAPYEETHHINMDHEDHDLKNLIPVCRKCHKRLHAAHSGYPKPWGKGRGIFADEIISIEPRKIEDVYDVHMPGPHHNFLANGIVVHNCAYGSWSFNKSHTISYGLITYWECWLKAVYPLEFAAASLNLVGNPDSQLALLRELVEEGYEYKPVDPEHSIDRWNIAENKLIGPLHNIKGIGPKHSATIMRARETGTTLTPGLRKKLETAKTPLDDLFPVKSAIERLCPEGLSSRNILTEPMRIADVRDSEEGMNNVLVVGVVTSINIRDENEAVNVAKRGYVLDDGSPTQSLNTWIMDDSGKVFAKIRRWDYERIGAPVVKRGRAGKSVYAMKGHLWIGGTFRMLMVKQVRYLGDTELDVLAT